MGFFTYYSILNYFGRGKSYWMENHPIPQDITGFQFKLIGFMTVRQFVYIAVVVITGWIISFILPIPHIISWPISIIILLIGAVFTFIPIDGRPMDTMLINLIKAILSPTKYVYGKDGGDISNTQKQTEPMQAPQSIPLPAPQQVVNQAPHTPLMQTVELQQAAAPAQPSSLNTPITTNPNQPTEEELAKANAQRLENENEAKQEKARVLDAERKIDEETKLLEKQIEANKTLDQASTFTSQPVTNQKITELEKMLAEVTRQKEELEREVLKINAKLESHATTAVIPAPATSAENNTNPTQEEPRVKQVSPDQTKTAGTLGAPETPNLITGIVKDPRGNPLQNILVEVKDEEDNPVRAFKTNGLGRFASATPVSNGKYFLTFEDPKEENRFDTVQIQADGHPIMPIEIASIDKREELRRELFN